MPRPLSPILPAIAALALTLLIGCTQSHTPTTQPTTVPIPPAVQAILTQLQAVNTEPPSLSGIFTWTTTQDQAARFAEQVFNCSPPMEYLNAATTRPSKESPETIALRSYTRDMLKAGPPQGIYTEEQRYQQRQQGKHFLVSRTWTSDSRDYLPPVIMAWTGQSGLRYEPTLKWAQAYSNRDDLLILDGAPAIPRFFSFRLPFPNLTGQIRTRRATINGEQILILRQDLPSLYREYYLSAKDGYLPRRIIQRMKEKQGMTRRDMTITVDHVSADPTPAQTKTEITIPAAPLKFLDWDHGTWDSDTSIQSYARRPDGQWFITESRTTYPFFRRTETFKAENLSFAPLPATAFEVQIPPDVPIRH